MKRVTLSGHLIVGYVRKEKEEREKDMQVKNRKEGYYARQRWCGMYICMHMRGEVNGARGVTVPRADDAQ